MTIRNLDGFFRPKSIAIVGGSAQLGSLGHAVLKAVRGGAFQGDVYAVNPKGGTVGGQPIYASVADLPAPPDLAVIITPPHTVAAVVSELGRQGCKAGVVLSAGFGEGETGGAQFRSDLLAAARPHLFRIIGPNCLGIMVPSIGLNASFARTPAMLGGLALVAQSGAIASALLDWAQPRGIGFSHVVTVGDMIDVDFGDMLDYLSGDENTHAILLYVEGVTNPRKFMSAARRAARLKPVLAIKGGRHSESAKVAASHTGALAGADAVYDAVFARAGILRVDDLDDLCAAAELLAMAPPVVGDRLAILTNGGGLGVLAADRLLTEHGRLAKLSDETRVKLNQALPATWSHGNPIDIIGDASVQRYSEATAALLEDEENDAILIMYCPTSAVDPRAVASVVTSLARGSDSKPLLAAWVGEASVADARADLRSAHIATFSTPREAVSAFMQLVRYRKLQDLLLEVPPPTEGINAPTFQEARAVIDDVSDEKWLQAGAAKRLLALYGIPVNRTAIAATPADAKSIACSWGCRVALKVSSPDVVHKSDVNGVVLDVDPTQADIEATRMIQAVREHVPQARVEGILVEEMVKRPGAHELFIGMTSDGVFGPVLAFGHGGTGIEVINDKAFGLPPLNLKLAESMIAETRVGRLLAGYRNTAPANTPAVARALVGLSQLVCDHPQIVDLDINPLLVDADGVIALDARIKVSPRVMSSRLIISPYPRHLERLISRPGRKSFHIRPLQPQDTPLIETFVRRLSLEVKSFRFFGPVHESDRRVAARLCQLDYDRELTLVATRAPECTEVMALARFCGDPDNIEAEFEIVVRPDLQGEGVGQGLLTYLRAVAVARGIRRLWGGVLPDNGRMLSLAKACGMRVEQHGQNNTMRLVYDVS